MSLTKVLLVKLKTTTKEKYEDLKVNVIIDRFEDDYVCMRFEIRGMR